MSQTFFIQIINIFIYTFSIFQMHDKHISRFYVKCFLCNSTFRLFQNIKIVKIKPKYKNKNVKWKRKEKTWVASAWCDHVVSGLVQQQKQQAAHSRAQTRELCLAYTEIHAPIPETFLPLVAILGRHVLLGFWFLWYFFPSGFARVSQVRSLLQGFFFFRFFCLSSSRASPSQPRIFRLRKKSIASRHTLSPPPHKSSWAVKSSIVATRPPAFRCGTKVNVVATWSGCSWWLRHDPQLQHPRDTVAARHSDASSNKVRAPWHLPREWRF